jgi:hypothetical protein
MLPLAFFPPLIFVLIIAVLVGVVLFLVLGGAGEALRERRDYGDEARSDRAIPAGTPASDGGRPVHAHVENEPHPGAGA